MRKITKMAAACHFLFFGGIIILLGGVDVASAQLGNTTVTGTLGVTSTVTLNSSSGTTTINGNLTLGKNSSNTIKFNGVASSNLNMGENNILNLQSLTVGEPFGVSAPYSPITGSLKLYNSAGTGSATIQAANTGAANYTYTIPNGGADGTFMMTTGAQTVTGDKTFSNTTDITAPLVASNTVASGTALAVTSGNVNITGLTPSSPVFTDASNNLTNSGTVPAVNGGTGNNTYAVGDILVASSTTTLTRLPAGTAGQVVGISPTGVVTYLTNGATVTNNVLSQTVPATEDLGVSNAAGYIRLTNSTGSTLNVTGVQVNPNFANGSVITLVNVSTDPSDVIQITNLDGGSASVDQFDLPGAQPILLTQKGAATFIYDGTLSKWELVSTN